MGKFLPAFKAYDVRGIVPTELNEDLAYQIGRAYADEVKPRKVCVGYDIRLSGPSLYDALAKGLNDAGVDVVHLGLVGTEMVYFATAYYGFDGGVMITASHNPPEYNGLKMVRSESRPISGDTGLYEIERRAYEQKWERSGTGVREELDCYDDFVAHLLKIVDPNDIKRLKVLCDVGNGAAGVLLRKLTPKTPLNVTERLYEPDGNFPNGVPNPILEESRKGTMDTMHPYRGGEGGTPFDFGVAWDGDYDRCFFFDEVGTFIEGYYIVGLIAQTMLASNVDQTIVYDPRLTWNTLDIVHRLGGKSQICKSGHAFIKEKMREVDAAYGGEMSAHHYFKSHWYCDSGMIPFLLVAKLISQSGQSLGELVGEMTRRYPCSGEVNSKVADVQAVLQRVEAQYGLQGSVHKLDGLSIDCGTWRFNLRGSNTEPVIRLNVESRGDRALMEAKTKELLKVIRS
jgi:phosphomannomutase